MKYGVRDVVDVVLRAKGTMDLGSKRFYKNEPVLYFDTLTTSSLEGQATTVYAAGGTGAARLVAWEGERTVTYTMEDALISPESLSVLTGAGLIDASTTKPVYQHIVETTDDFSYANSILTVYVDKEPFLPKPISGGAVENENYACVMITKDGEVISEPYIVAAANEYNATTGVYAASTAETTGTHIGKYKLEVKANGCNFGKDISCHDDTATYDPTDLANDNDRGNAVLVDYYTPIRSGAKRIEIDAENFAGNYYLEGSTLWRDTNGIDHPAEFVIPNAKIQSNFTFTMASTGDPSTFTFTMDAFPDYTRFDKTHKVFAEIQVLESAANGEATDLHRGSTYATAEGSSSATTEATLDNHDNR